MSQPAIDTVLDLAREVHEVLGGGYSETVYEEALGIAMREEGIDYHVQHTVEVFFRDQKVGEQVLDYAIVATGRVIELKAVGSISKVHRAQLAAYLRTTGVDRGLIVNFPPEGELQTEFVDASQ